MHDVSHFHDHGEELSRETRIRRVLVSVLVLNVAVAAAKLVAGRFSGSVSLEADGYHSMLDGSSNVIGLFALAAAARAPDSDHPYGHAKFEPLAVLGISFLLFLAAWEIAGEAFARFQTGGDVRITRTEFGVIGATLAVNAAVAWGEARAGRVLRSDFLLADAAHTRSDLFVSLSVLVSFFCVRNGWPSVDLAVALGIAAFIFWTGIGIVRRGTRSLVDEAVLDPAALAAVALRVPGVNGCHDARTRGTERAIYGDLRIHVEPGMPIREAHEIAHRVEEDLMKAFPGLREVIVHVEPGTTADPGEDHGRFGTK